MKKLLLSILVLTTGIGTANAIDNNTVNIIYNGTRATVTIAANINQYITVSSGTSSHVVIVQDPAFAGINADEDNPDGEIIYNLSGTSSDGEFHLTGTYKCMIELNGLTLTNPDGPALNIQNGKRIEMSAQKGTTNTLTDGANEQYNGCIHCKGHLKLKGKGTLNITGNSKHAIYSKEYLKVKNLTLNVNSAVKDGLHCKEFFLMESGTITINNTQEDGIQVELSGLTPTGITTDHEDEDTGNFYMEAGTLTISNCSGNNIKADGIITYTGGTQNFDKNNTAINAGIENITVNGTISNTYDLQGRATNSRQKGLYIVRQDDKAKKVLMK